jgi:hypothetical protein
VGPVAEESREDGARVPQAVHAAVLYFPLLFWGFFGGVV